MAVPHPDEWPSLPGSLKEAVAVGEPFFYTGGPCKHGHLSVWRVTSKGKGQQCVECHNASVRKRRAIPEVREARNAARRERRASDPENREAVNARVRKRRADPVKREAENARNLARTRKRAEAGYFREQRAAWRKANPGLFRASIRRNVHRTPPWLTDEQRAKLVRIYDECPTGHHVDHIVPLKHKLVAGLHVPQNLCYLPGPENIAKGNRLDMTSEEAVEFIAMGRGCWADHTDNLPRHFKVPCWEKVAYANPSGEVDIPPMPRPREQVVRPAAAGEATVEA